MVLNITVLVQYFGIHEKVDTQNGTALYQLHKLVAYQYHL